MSCTRRASSSSWPPGSERILEGWGRGVGELASFVRFLSRPQHHIRCARLVSRCAHSSNPPRTTDRTRICAFQPWKGFAAAVLLLLQSTLEAFIFRLFILISSQISNNGESRTFRVYLCANGHVHCVTHLPLACLDGRPEPGLRPPEESVFREGEFVAQLHLQRPMLLTIRSLMLPTLRAIPT